MSGKFLEYGSKGATVKRLQRAINDNPYFKPRRKLKVDGQMKTLTCAAVQRGKRRLGYPGKALGIDLDDVFAGNFFLEILEGSRPLPAAYKLRRRKRLRAIAAQHEKNGKLKEMRLRALRIIKAELGTMERGGNTNRIKYNTWWGWGAVAYCVIGLSWAWVKAGSKAFVKGSRWAGTDLMLAEGKQGSHGLHLTNDPDPGCPGVIDFDGHSDPDHAITFVKDNGDGTCETYEFNTTSSGGVAGVWKKDRPLANCWWFVVEK